MTYQSETKTIHKQKTNTMNATEQAFQLRNLIASVTETLTNEMQAWERKEYSSLLNDYKQELKELEAHIQLHNL